MVAPRTIFKGAKKLQPGESLCIRRGQPIPAPKLYWDVRFTLDNPLSLADATAELTERLRESVRLRMISDVPLGAFLSGGVDSALVAALAVDALGPERVHCVMLPYRFTSGESLADAAACAKALGCRYDSVAIQPAVEGLYGMLDPLFAGRPRDITEENV